MSKRNFPDGLKIRHNLRPGDLGWVLYLHGVVYFDEYGYDHTFEGYVAEGLAEFAKGYDENKDRLWVVEKEGKIVGSIAILSRPDNEAQLRWFILSQDIRGCGLGRLLLNKAIAFCREKNYKQIYLWTVSNLDAAVHLYKTLGFVKDKEETHEIWGQNITEARYFLKL